MADNDHKSIPTGQRHNPKGFEDAANSTQLTKDSSGNIAWNALPNASLTTVILNIGDWDMDATATITVNHSLSATERMTINLQSVMIRNDADTLLTPLNSIFNTVSGGVNGYVLTMTTLSFQLTRVGSCIFDSVDYDSTSYNRGFITFEYVKD